MKFTVEIPDHVVKKYAEFSKKEISEELAEEAYQHVFIMEYLYPINPDGTTETETFLTERIYSLITAAVSTISKLQIHNDTIRTARNTIDLCKLAFGGKNG